MWVGFPRWIRSARNCNPTPNSPTPSTTIH
jgi:hypothetical protein